MVIPDSSHFIQSQREKTKSQKFHCVKVKLVSPDSDQEHVSGPLESIVIGLRLTFLGSH